MAGLCVEARLLLLQIAIGLHHFIVQRCLTVGIGACALELVEPAAERSHRHFGQIEVQLLMVQQLFVASLRTSPASVCMRSVPLLGSTPAQTLPVVVRHHERAGSKVARTTRLIWPPLHSHDASMLSQLIEPFVAPGRRTSLKILANEPPLLDHSMTFCA